jgi:hypothetical protein
VSEVQHDSKAYIHELAQAWAMGVLVCMSVCVCVCVCVCVALSFTHTVSYTHTHTVSYTHTERERERERERESYMGGERAYLSRSPMLVLRHKASFSWQFCELYQGYNKTPKKRHRPLPTRVVSTREPKYIRVPVLCPVYWHSSMLYNVDIKKKIGYLHYIARDISCGFLKL